MMAATISRSDTSAGGTDTNTGGGGITPSTSGGGPPIATMNQRPIGASSSEIEASIVMKGCIIRSIPGRIDSSLLADNSQVEATPHLPAAHKFILAENSYVQL